MQIASETELVNILIVSRMTVNRALRELTAEGRLIRIQGRGTFVAKKSPVNAAGDTVNRQSNPSTGRYILFTYAE